MNNDISIGIAKRDISEGEIIEINLSNINDNDAVNFSKEGTIYLNDLFLSAMFFKLDLFYEDSSSNS